jgi:hypothetical protein
MDSFNGASGKYSVLLKVRKGGVPDDPKSSITN